jgi:hypothetical protein
MSTFRLRRAFAENIASTMIVHSGIAVIWQLHLDAVSAYREGNKAAAAAIIDIADAADREWLPRNGCAD